MCGFVSCSWREFSLYVFTCNKGSMQLNNYEGSMQVMLYKYVVLFLVCRRNLVYYFWIYGVTMVWPFKWKLLSSTSRGTVDYAVQGGSNFWVCGWNPMVLPFKWKLLSSTFLWYCLWCTALKVVLTFESVDEFSCLTYLYFPNLCLRNWSCVIGLFLCL